MQYDGPTLILSLKLATNEWKTRGYKFGRKIIEILLLKK